MSTSRQINVSVAKRMAGVKSKGKLPKGKLPKGRIKGSSSELIFEILNNFLKTQVLIYTTREFY